jgi:hypothetical protein
VRGSGVICGSGDYNAPKYPGWIDLPHGYGRRMIADEIRSCPDNTGL